MDEHGWFSFVLCHKGDIDDGTRDKKEKETDCSGLYKVASMPPLIIPRRSNAYANARNQTASPSPFRTGQIMQEIKKRKGKSNHRAVSATWGRHIQRRNGQREKPLMPVPGWALDPPIGVSIVGGRGLGVARNCFCGMFFFVLQGARMEVFAVVARAWFLLLVVGGQTSPLNRPSRRR